MSKETTQAPKIDNGWLLVHLLASNGNTRDVFTLAQSGDDINAAIESRMNLMDLLLQFLLCKVVMLKHYCFLQGWVRI